MIDSIYCTPSEDDIYVGSGRFKDAPRALNYMHDSLSRDTPLEEKCKRYAVLLSMCAMAGLPYEHSVLELVALDDYHLNKQYQEIGADSNDLSSLYMSAIDRYRITQLAAPFLEIIDCLKKIDVTPSVEKYLSNQELKIVVDLYKKVLGLPVTPDNLSGVDLSKFHPSFQTTLRRLFQGHLDLDHTSDLSRSQHLRHNSRWRIIDFSDEQELSSLGLLDEQELAVERQRQKRVLRQRRYRERHVHRVRERSRLTQQRLRALYPDKMREQNTSRQRLQRERLKQLAQEESYRQSFSGNVPPDEALQDRRSRRALRNLKRRLRRQEVPEHQENDREMGSHRLPVERQIQIGPTRQGRELLLSHMPTLDRHHNLVIQRQIGMQQAPQIRPAVPLVNRMTWFHWSTHPSQPSESHSPPTRPIRSNAEMQDRNQMLDEVVSTYMLMPADTDLQHRRQAANCTIENESREGQSQFEGLSLALWSFDPQSSKEVTSNKEPMRRCPSLLDTDTNMQLLYSQSESSSRSPNIFAVHQPGPPPSGSTEGLNTSKDDENE